MVEVRWTAQSIEDIRSIAEFISKESKKYADSQVDSFFVYAEILESFPNAGRIVPETNNKALRELLIGSYRVIYEIISSKRIDILAVHHSARLLKNSPVFQKKIIRKKKNDR